MRDWKILEILARKIFLDFLKKVLDFCVCGGIIETESKKHTNHKQEVHTMTKYILTVGTFDKDTKKAEIPLNDCRAILSNAVAQRFDGGTIYEADGIYRHIDGQTVREPSLRVELLGCKREDVLELAQYMKKALNQESIMFEEIEEHYDFI